MRKLFTMFILLVSVSLLHAQADDLFFSEYLEGSSNNKAFEVFNGTGADVDLSAYRVIRANNGSLALSDSLVLTGTLSNNDVFVIANPSATGVLPEIVSAADVFSTLTYYNGDDFMGLQKNVGGTWVTIDVIGILGEDPGTNWTVGATGATSEFTLVRKPNIAEGTTDWALSAGTTDEDSQWLIYAQNTIDYLGAHTFEAVIPVELVSFSAAALENSVRLDWKTATEVNNSGFEVEKADASKNWKTVNFVQGNGTSTEIHNYSYVDNDVVAGTYTYRLKQIDFDGTFSYSSEIEVVVGAPVKYELAQNFPNPFNPTTNIRFSIPEQTNVKITVYTLLGQEVTTILDQSLESGVHNYSFDASNLNSGVYYYRIKTDNFVDVKKMMLVK